MSKPVVIFGFGDMAQMAHHYFSIDSVHQVAAFTLDRAYITEATFCGLPVVPFDEIETLYPAADHAMFVALGYSRVNQLRKEKYLAAKALGYDIASYVSSMATVLNQGRIGENCFILEDNTIQPFVTIGNNVVMWSGNHVGHHSTIHDHCFLASHIVVSGGVDLGESCFVGVDATFRDHIRIGESCVIGAGALLLADADPFGVYVGTATERSRVPQQPIEADINMHWRKLGHIFVADRHSDWMYSHAMIPVAEQIEGDLYRVYFSPGTRQIADTAPISTSTCAIRPRCSICTNNLSSSRVR